MKAIERIYQYIDIKGIKIVAFEKKCGISNGYLGKMYKRKADIGESILVQILENCPDLSPEWLLTGGGQMKMSSENIINIKPVDNEWILKRFEELVAENALLKKEVEELRTTRGKPANATNYPEFSPKIGTGIAAEPKK